MTKQRFISGVLFWTGLVFAFWAGGLVLFVAQVTRYVEPKISQELDPTDAIVVLTGGSERLAAGIELLKAGKGKKLLISGVYPGVGLDRVLSGTDVSEELRTCCIALGYAADNTLGNAAETLAFMEKEGFHSLRLVTANYHMPRSHLFFRRRMPDLRITIHPVSPDIVSLSDWWVRPGTTSLLIGEYNKYLYARLRAFLGVF